MKNVFQQNNWGLNIIIWVPTIDNKSKNTSSMDNTILNIEIPYKQQSVHVYLTLIIYITTKYESKNYKEKIM